MIPFAWIDWPPICRDYTHRMPSGEHPRGISHDRGEEDILAKARWFSQFTPEQRLWMLIEWADAMLALNPAIEEVDRARPVAGRIQVLERP